MSYSPILNKRYNNISSPKTIPVYLSGNKKVTGIIANDSNSDWGVVVLPTDNFNGWCTTSEVIGTAEVEDPFYKKGVCVTNKVCSGNTNLFLYTNNGNKGNFSLSYFASEPDGYEPNQYEIEAGMEWQFDNEAGPTKYNENKAKKFMSNLGTRNKTATKIEKLSFDSHADVDVYPIDVNAGDKVTVCMELDCSIEESSNYVMGIANNVRDQMNYEDDYTKSISYIEDFYYCKSFTYSNAENKKQTMFATWVANKGGRCYIHLGRRGIDGSQGEPVNYDLTVTKTVGVRSDPREVRGNNWYTNDFIKINNQEVAEDITSSAVGIGEIDNQLDVDWFKYTATETGKKTITLDGKTYFAVVHDNTMTPGGRKLDYNMIAGETYYIGVYCPDGMYGRIMNKSDYSVSVKNSESNDDKTQTAYIVLYDSEILQSSSSTETGKSRYLDENGDEYNYTTEFFQNYLSMIGDKKAAFIISVRDIDFDRYTIDGAYDRFTWLTLPSITQNHINSVVSRSSQRTIDIIKNIKQACNLDGYQMPEIYIGTPHAYHDVIESADLSGEQTVESAETNFLNKYMDAVESIYNAVLADSSINESDITGLYYGREEASPIYDSVNKYNLNYRNMSQVSDFIHGKGKKLVWIPYAGDEEIWNNIGEIVNTGRSCYAQNNDIFDFVMLQPGLFYSNYSGSLDEIKNYNVNLSSGSNGYDFNKYKAKELYLSTSAGVMLSHGAIIGGEKITDTDISFELEYDISLVTGRYHSANRVFPKQKADNFNITYDYYKDLIYTSEKSFGIYPGGPNELDYTYDNITNQKNINGLYGNINKHNIVNHLSALSEESTNYYDEGNNIAYVNFYDGIGSSHYNGTRDFGGLLYYITRGVLHNNWSDVNTKNYLGR